MSQTVTCPEEHVKITEHQETDFCTSVRDAQFLVARMSLRTALLPSQTGAGLAFVAVEEERA